MQRDARVGVGTGVEHYAISRDPYRLDAIDEVAFVIALIVGYLYVGVLLAQLSEVVVERTRAIYVGLSQPKHIQVRAIDDLNFFHRLRGCCVVRERIFLWWNVYVLNTMEPSHIASYGIVEVQFQRCRNIVVVQTVEHRQCLVVQSLHFTLGIFESAAGYGEVDELLYFQF